MAEARVLPASRFGKSIVIDMPAGCDMIVVFADLHQHVPVWIGMPHQLYAHTAAYLLREHAAETLTIAPYCNAAKVQVSRRFVEDALISERADG